MSDLVDSAALRVRYLTDAEFHAAVDSFSRLATPDGFADDYGVRHDGPTVDAARIVALLEEAWKAIPFPRSGAEATMVDDLTTMDKSRLARLEDYCVELRRMCAFLHSVILCREKWSNEDERSYRALVEP